MEMNNVKWKYMEAKFVGLLGIYRRERIGYISKGFTKTNHS